MRLGSGYADGEWCLIFGLIDAWENSASIVRSHMRCEIISVRIFLFFLNAYLNILNYIYLKKINQII